MADLYSIIVLMEHLEKAFIRDSITADEYTPQCANLIAKYKTTMNFLSDSVDNLETFMNDYKVSTTQHSTAQQAPVTKMDCW